MSTISKNDVAKIKQLSDKVLYHKKKYYNGEPEITDAAYDALEEKLRELDPDNPVLFIVGTPGGDKINHDYPMLSCQKATDLDEVVKWCGDRDLFVGYKIDGFSISLIYENNRLIQAATRGNGITGDDSTIMVMKIRTIPKIIPERSRIIVRGELVMHISEFKRINSLEPENYSSPRNLAVGTIKQKDLNLLDKRSLEFYAFELSGFRDEADLKTKVKILKTWGFKLADFCLLKHPSKVDLKSIFDKTEKERSKLDFEIDGLIFKYNEARDRESFGSTAHHPRWMIALKFLSQGEPSKIKKITWQVGRMGILTPVAEIEPIEIMGATIKRATLHNADFVETMDIAVGDTAMVIRSGDVIPKITNIIGKGLKHTSFPQNCPSCEKPLLRDGVNLICTNDKCREKEVQKIHHWVRTVDIIGLGPKYITKLYDSGLVQHYSDLYASKLTKNDLISLFGKNGSKIYENIRISKEIPFHIFLAALGIENLGIQMAKVLIKQFKSYDELKNTSIDHLTNIEGISDTTASYILKGLNDPSLGDKVLKNGVKIIYGKKKRRKLKQKKEDLTNFLFKKEEIVVKSNQKTKSVYVTGTIKGMTKKHIMSFLEENNFEWAPVTKNLDLLIIGDKPGYLKLEKAKKYGLSIKTWDEFLKDIS